MHCNRVAHLGTHALLSLLGLTLGLLRKPLGLLRLPPLLHRLRAKFENNLHNG